MRKIILCIFFPFICSNVFANFSGGNGSQSNPYLISSKADMVALADSVAKGNSWSKGKYFELTNDIIDPLLKPIGTYTQQFQGVFNGNNYSITLNVSSNDYVALFSHTESATIVNLVVNGYVAGNYIVGGIVAEANSSTISNCQNLAKITGVNYVGGIVASIRNSIDSTTISFCQNLGDISGSHIGGIVGCAGYAKIIIYNNMNAGYIIGNGGQYIGGIVGHNDSNNIIYNCINVGVVQLGQGIEGE